MSKAYVVVECGGSYSDYYYNNICVFLEKPAADNFVAIKNEQYGRIKKATNECNTYMMSNFWSGNPYTLSMPRKEREKLNQQRLQMEHNFYFALDYLTDKEKDRLTNLTNPSYFNTESDFSVEEVELMDEGTT